MRYPYPISILFLLLCGYCCFGQKQNNIWMFGSYAGIDFNSGIPNVIPSQIISHEGCATVSDANGNLLFYSNGKRVWDKNHQVMPNGTGLLGNSIYGNVTPGSATQGVAIIQSAANSNHYFLFVLEALEGPTNYPLRYSIVDMSLNGGLGDVIAGQKNLMLDTKMSEKMTVVPIDCGSFWLLAHRSDTTQYRAYKVDATGIHSPVISNTGVLPVNYSGNYPTYMVGEMKVSPDGKLVALVSWSDEAIEIAEFDINTGIVSNAKVLDSSALDANVGRGSYGISFSPNSKLLYSSSSGLFQYDLSALPNITTVRNTRNKISYGGVMGMRIGPDNKIYVAKVVVRGYVGCINNPDVYGPACNYVDSTLWVGTYTDPQTLHWQLGNDIGYIDLLADTTYSRIDTVFCGDSLLVTAPSGYINYLWNDGSTSQTNRFMASGVKWVQYKKCNHLFIDTIAAVKQVTSQSVFIHDTTVCFLEALLLEGPAGHSSYLWSNGSTSPVTTVPTNETAWVRSRLDCAERIDSFYISNIDFDINLGPDTVICPGDYLELDATVNGATYLWQNESTLATLRVGTPGTYSVQVTQEGCSKADTITVTPKVLDRPDLGVDTILCLGETLLLQVNHPGGNYLWQDGTTASTMVVDQAGTYSVTISEGNCTISDSIDIQYEKCDCIIAVPTAFTPNGDGRNDLFAPVIDCSKMEQYYLHVYNRWGQKLFHTYHARDKWDGTYYGVPVETGVYFYEFRYAFKGKTYSRKGDITLIR